MIKFKSEGDHGRTLYGFGLSKGNIENMLKGHPVHVNMEEMGMPGVDFMVFGDATKDDAELAESLHKLIGPDTVVKGSTDSQKPQ